MVKNLPAYAGDAGLFPGSGISLEEEMVTPMENSMDRGASQAEVHGTAKSDTTEPAHI